VHLYATTIFLGAFLLFQVQPLIGKFILPWFGGGPGVWTTCMLFFQLLLLAGYAYAHFLGSGFKPRTQARIHGAVLVLSLLTLPVIPSDSWKPAGDADPTMSILLLLAASVGLPYFALSTTGPLMQRWFSLSHPGASPYRLYALSNVGSLLALLSYPFVFEPALTRRGQAWTWSAAMVVFAIICGVCAWRLRDVPEERPAAPGATDADADDQPPGFMRKILWVLLPAAASVLLLASTNKMCQDVAVVPFLWVLPLALYLLTFIVSFDSPRWYSRRWWGAGLMVGLGAIAAAIQLANDIPLSLQVAIYSFGLFAICMCLHGELYRLRPHPRYLTAFYLMISAGGALGGLSVAVVAPLVFDDYYEFQIGLVAAGLVYIASVWHTRHALPTKHDGPRRSPPGMPAAAFPYVFAIVAGALAWAVTGSMVYGLMEHLPDKAQERLGELLEKLFTNPPSTNAMLKVHLVAALILLFTGAWLSRYLPPVRRWLYNGLATVLGAVALAGVALWLEVVDDSRSAVSSARNFYGTLKVLEYNPGEDINNYYVLQHGRITHGMQLRHETYRNWPTTYYGPVSGVGLAAKKLPRQENQRVAVVGLGTGSMAVYGKPGDTYRFYEINPAVTNIALTQFTHLTDCRARGATVDIAMGDARLSMEREEPQQFDLIVLDAFSSDAIPVHLLTLESFELYRRHLKPDGVIAVHISNRHLDLEPVVLGIADKIGWKTAIVENSDGDLGVRNDSEESNAWWIYTSIWVLVTSNEELLKDADITDATNAPRVRAKPIRMWTDDYTSLSQILEEDLIPGWSKIRGYFNQPEDSE
jgi:hypothetical protein